MSSLIEVTRLFLVSFRDHLPSKTTELKAYAYEICDTARGQFLPAFEANEPGAELLTVSGQSCFSLSNIV